LRYIRAGAAILAAAVLATLAMTFIGTGPTRHEAVPHLPGVANYFIKTFSSPGPETLYWIYLGGWVVRFAAGGVLPQAVGVHPEDVVFAYFDGQGWHTLPYRAYDFVANGAYVLVNGTIKTGTLIEARLPAQAPSFAKGSLAVALRVRDRFGNAEGVIYAFIGGGVRYSPSAWAPLTNSGVPWAASPFMTAGFPMLVELATISAYSPEYSESLALALAGGEYAALAEQLYSVRIGGDIDGHNLVEVRPAPTAELLKSPIVLDRERSKYSFRYYTVGPGVSDAAVKGVAFIVIADPENRRPGVAEMRVRIGSSDCGISLRERFLLYADRANIVWVPIDLENTCAYLDVSVDIASTAGTAWWVRVRSVAFIEWGTSNDTLYEGLTHEVIQVFGSSAAKPSVLGLSLGPGKLVDAVSFAAPLPKELAVPGPGRYVGMGLVIKAFTEEGTPPISVAASIGPYSCSTIAAPGESGRCVLDVPGHYIAAEAGAAQAIISVAAVALAEPPKPVKLRLEIYAESPMVIPSRPMTFVEAGNGSVVATSTYPLSSEVFHYPIPYHVGGLYISAPSGDSDSLEVAVASADFMREPLTASPMLSKAFIHYWVRVFEGPAALPIPAAGPGTEYVVAHTTSLWLSLPQTYSLLSSNYVVRDISGGGAVGTDAVAQGQEVIGGLTMVEYLFGVSTAYGGVLPLMEYSRYLRTYLMLVGMDTRENVINVTVTAGEMCGEVAAEVRIIDVSVGEELPALAQITARVGWEAEALINFSIRW